jgi:drug/metabolite transporter (DMT)-like permease
VAALVGGGGSDVDPIGIAAVLCASLSWATGTVLSRRLELPRSVLVATSLQMASGAALLGVAAGVSGQVRRVALAGLGGFELACFLWLVLAGSVGALLAYNWLLRNTTPALATTYAYVNPLVAVWLGWWIGGEHLGARTLGASGLIVAAVALLTLTSRPKGRGTPAASTSAERPPAAPSTR